MIRTICLGLALSTASAAVYAAPAYAQTTQTDQSEDEWRKFKKKSSTTTDIFDPKGGLGIGSLPPLSPVETLPDESKRHLKRMRAKIIAESDPGKTPDYSYEASAAAQSDPDLERDEKEAWSAITDDMKARSGSGQSQPPGGSPGDPSAAAGQAGSQPSQQSVMRGGSATSAADIMAQIKNLGGLPQSAAQQTQTPSGERPAGQSSSSPGAENASQSPQDQAQAQAAAQQAAQAQASSQQNSDAQAQADAQSEAQSAAQQAAEGADAGSAAPQAETAAQDGGRARDSMGPLERLRADRSNDSGGRRTSASDFLNKAKSSE